MLTALQVPLGEFPSSGWESFQRGAGLYATCRGCNSFGGRAYIPSYTGFVASALDALVEWGSSAPSGRPPARLQMRAEGIRLGAVVRQALFMMLVASGSAGLGDRYPVLRRLVLDQAPGQLPSDIRLYLSFVMTSRIRINSTQVRMDLASGTSVAMVEVAGPPFAWLLEIGYHSMSTAQDVSSWTQYSSADEVGVDITTVLGSAINPFAGDYRHLWEIEADTS